MFNNVKTIFIDLDGTALDVKKDGAYFISDENIKAINEKKKEGKIIVVSTGRLGLSSDRYIKAIKPLYSVTGNGAIILDKDMNVLKEYNIDVENNKKLVDIISSRNLVIKLEDHKHAYGVTREFAIKQAKDWAYRPIKDYSFDLSKKYFKYVIWGTEDKDELLELQKEIYDKVDNVSSSISNGGYTLEVTHSKANKGDGNSFVANLLGNTLEETIHIGDSMNDAHVIGHVGKFVVLDNASEAVKKLSIWRGANYKDAGLAKTLRGEFWKVED